MHLIIALRVYSPATAPPTIGEFEWTAKHGAYVWQGRELPPAEFNEVVDDVFARNRDLWAHPLTVRAVEGGQVEEAVAEVDDVNRTDGTERTIGRVSRASRTDAAASVGRGPSVKTSSTSPAPTKKR